MLIRVGYEIQFEIAQELLLITMMNIHSSRLQDLRTPDVMQTEPKLAAVHHVDGYGNRCCRLKVPQGNLRLWCSTIIEDSGHPDEENWSAEQVEVEYLPPAVLPYLSSSRYCEVDLLSEIAWDLFGHVEQGWARVQAICDWVHGHVRFGYEYAGATKSADDVLRERKGVCRDFQHLAITFCRCLNIPARYAAGYLGDFGVPAMPYPMDFNAWFEVFLGDRWWAFDARHNERRIGRVLVARGRDAVDTAITTAFGPALLRRFSVITEEWNCT